MTELDSGSRAVAGLDEIMGLLFPEPAQVRLTRRPTLFTDADAYLVLPSLSNARVVLPVDPALAAAALRHARRPLSVRARLLTATACALLRFGLGRLVPSRMRVTRARAGDSLLGLLDGVFGHQVSIGVFLGPPRSNRKPVLQILGRDGTLLGIAKIGINTLTRELSRTEGHALAELERRDLKTLVTPRLLFRGEWQGLSVLVQSALPIWTSTPSTDGAALDRAMRELAESGATRHEQLAGGRFVRHLRERLGGLEDTALTSLARRALDSIDSGADGEVALGSWHGDWTAWNMAQTPARALVWDWERFEEGVPVGFDALHHAFQLGLKELTQRSGLGLDLLERAPAILHPYGVEARPARTIAACYLIHVGTRYLIDRQSETGVGGGVVDEWLTPALEQFLATPGQQDSPGHG